MDNPNTVYKLAYAELAEKLGRPPTCNELLPLHEEYKRAFVALPDEIAKADREYEGRVFGKAAASRLEPGGFSRQLAPQARALDTELKDNTGFPHCYGSLCQIGLGGDCSCTCGFCRDRVRALDTDTRESVAQGAASLPLSGPDKPANAGAAVSEPEPSPVNPGGSERAPRPPREYVGRSGRGPNGGVLADCVACGREWERPLRAGRPASLCEECRG